MRLFVGRWLIQSRSLQYCRKVRDQDPYNEKVTGTYSILYTDLYCTYLIFFLKSVLFETIPRRD